MTRIRLSKNATDFIRRETEYLRQRSESAARSFSRTIRHVRQILQQYPHAGNRMHGLTISKGLTLVSDNYVFDYVYDGTDVSIFSIRHGRMQMAVPDPDLDRDL